MRQADKQTKSLFNGRVGYYNLKLKRKGFYNPPCPTLKSNPSAPLEWMGGSRLTNTIDRANYSNLQTSYDIIYSQIEKEFKK